MPSTVCTVHHIRVLRLLFYISSTCQTSCSTRSCIGIPYYVVGFQAVRPAGVNFFPCSHYGSSRFAGHRSASLGEQCIYHAYISHAMFKFVRSENYCLMGVLQNEIGVLASIIIDINWRGKYKNGWWQEPNGSG